MKEKESSMDEQKKKKIDRTFFRLSLLPLAGAVAYMVFSAFTKKKLGIDYYVVLGLGLVLHWLLSDVLSVVYSKGFEDKTEEQVKAYKIYALLNLAGFAGLGYFACSVGNSGGIFGALAYVMTLSIKRKYLDEYKGIVKKEDTEEDEEPETEEAGKEEVQPEEVQPEEKTE